MLIVGISHQTAPVELRERVDFRGVFTIDGILSARGWVANECNPRFGAALAYTRGLLPDAPLDLVHHMVIAGDGGAVTARDLEEVGADLGVGRVVVVERDRQPLADAVELQHVVAESHWQQTRQALVVIEFGALRLPVQHVRHAHRHLTVAPDFENRRIIRGKQIVSTRIDETRHAKPI